MNENDILILNSVKILIYILLYFTDTNLFVWNVLLVLSLYLFI